MDYNATVAIVGTGLLTGGTLAFLWHMAKREARQYQNVVENVNWEQQAIVLEAPPAIDWTKPLELLDGTPVRLGPYGFGGKNPDKDGDFWVEREDGGRIAGTQGGAYYSMCVHPNGCEENTEIVIVRNRTEAPAVPAPANSNLPQLTPDQRTVLLEMSQVSAKTAAYLREATGLPHVRVVEARQQLAAMGLAHLSTPHGGGRGYLLNSEGVVARNALLAADDAAA